MKLATQWNSVVVILWSKSIPTTLAVKVHWNPTAHRLGKKQWHRQNLEKSLKPVEDVMDKRPWAQTMDYNMVWVMSISFFSPRHPKHTHKLHCNPPLSFFNPFDQSIYFPLSQLFFKRWSIPALLTRRLWCRGTVSKAKTAPGQSLVYVTMSFYCRHRDQHMTYTYRLVWNRRGGKTGKIVLLKYPLHPQ